MIMIAKAITMNILWFIGICTLGCLVGMGFTGAILFAKRNSPDYEMWENRVARVFWRIIFLCILIATYIVVFVIKP